MSRVDRLAPGESVGSRAGRDIQVMLALPSHFRQVVMADEILNVTHVSGQLLGNDNTLRSSRETPWRNVLTNCSMWFVLRASMPKFMFPMPCVSQFEAAMSRYEYVELVTQDKLVIEGGGCF